MAGTREGARLLLGAALGGPELWLAKTKKVMRVHGPHVAALMAFPRTISLSSRTAEQQTCPPLLAERPAEPSRRTQHHSCIASLSYPVHRQPHTVPSPSWPRKPGTQAGCSFCKEVPAIPLHPQHCSSSGRVWFSLSQGPLTPPWPPLPAALGGEDECLHWLRNLAQFLCI